MPLEPPPPRAKKFTQKQQFDAVWTDQNNADYDASTCWTASLAPTAEELQEFTSRAHRINQTPAPAAANRSVLTAAHTGRMRPAQTLAAAMSEISTAAVAPASS